MGKKQEENNDDCDLDPLWEDAYIHKSRTKHLASTI